MFSEFPRPRVFPFPRPVEMHFAAPGNINTQPSPQHILAEEVADRIIELNDQAVQAYYNTNDTLYQQDIIRAERDQIQSLIQSHLPGRDALAAKKLAAEHLADQLYLINNDVQNKLPTATPDEAVTLRDEQKRKIVDILEPHITPARRGLGFLEGMGQSGAGKRARRLVAGGFLAGVLVSAAAVGAYALHERNDTQVSPQTLAPGICKTLPAGSVAVVYDSTLDGAKIYNDPNSAAVIELFKPGTICAGTIKGQYQIVHSTDPGRLGAIADNYKTALQESGCSGGFGCTYVTTIIDR